MNTNLTRQEIKEISEWFYHKGTAESLEICLDKNNPGFTSDIRIDAMEKYNSNTWQEAYRKALKFHEERSREDGFTKKAWEWFFKHKTEVLSWIDRSVVIGGLPKEEFQSKDTSRIYH